MEAPQLTYSEESAAAVAWMQQFVRDINYNEDDGYDEEKEQYINERPSGANPHSYARVIGQGDEVKESGEM